MRRIRQASSQQEKMDWLESVKGQWEGMPDDGGWRYRKPDPVHEERLRKLAEAARARGLYSSLTNQADVEGSLFRLIQKVRQKRRGV